MTTIAVSQTIETLIKAVIADRTDQAAINAVIDLWLESESFLLESWQKIWRLGFAPQYQTEALEMLRAALIEDDQRLIQGGTTTPPPLHATQDFPLEAGDVIAFIGLCTRVIGLHNPTENTIDTYTVGEAEEFFARSCYNCDEVAGEPAACRWFLNWWDETAREEALGRMLVEVEWELKRRKLAGG